MLCGQHDLAVCVQQDGSDMTGTKLIERLENELVAQTAALDTLLNPGGRRERKQAALPLSDSQVTTTITETRPCCR